MSLPVNLSDMERLIRAILGIYAMLLGFLFIQGVVGIILGIGGLMLLLTGITGYCWLYTRLGRASGAGVPADPADEQE